MRSIVFHLIIGTLQNKIISIQNFLRRNIAIVSITQKTIYHYIKDSFNDVLSGGHTEILQTFLRETLWSVEDPGFSGGRVKRYPIIWHNLFRKLHGKKTNWAERGRAFGPWGTLLYSNYIFTRRKIF